MKNTRVPSKNYTLSIPVNDFCPFNLRNIMVNKSCNGKIFKYKICLKTYILMCRKKSLE